MVKVLDATTSTALNQPNFIGACVCQGDELSRVLRTGLISSRAIGLTELLGNHPLSPSKVSGLSGIEGLDRVGQIAESNRIGAAAQSRNSIDDLLQILDDENERLTNPEILLSEEVNSLFKEDEPEADRRNFLIQVNQLVAEIMQLLSKLSDRDRKKTDHMKEQYGKLNDQIARATREQGWIGLGCAVAAFIVTGGSVAIGGDAGYKIGSAIAQQIQPIVGVYTSKLQAESGKASSKTNLINTELQNTASRNSDNSGWKQELIGALNDVKEWMKASVRSNG